MHKEFDIWVRQRYGYFYDLTRGAKDLYCCEVVRRMFEVWCYCRGLKVV